MKLSLKNETYNIIKIILYKRVCVFFNYILIYLIITYRKCLLVIQRNIVVH